MFDWLNTQYFEQNLFWAALQHVTTSLLFALCGTVVMNKALGFLKTRREQVWFIAGVSSCFLIFLICQARSVSNGPNLIPEIYLVGLPSGGPNLDAEGRPLVTIQAGVTNTGAMASVVTGYKFDLLMNGSTYHGRKIAVPKNITVKIPGEGPGTEETLTDKQALYERTSIPIGPGDRKSGLLLFDFPELREDALKDASVSFTLYITDVLQHTTSTTMIGGTSMKNLPVIPGMSQN